MKLSLRRLIPNGLSLVRLLLGVAYFAMPLEWRLPVVAIAALTDALDGLAARWLHAESDTGRILDPLADKVFVLAIVAAAIGERTLDPWWALGVLARDLVVAGGIAMTFLLGRGSEPRRFQPSWLGKLTTAAQFALLLALIAMQTSWPWLLLLTSGLSIAAAVHYAWTFLRGIRSAETST